MEDATSDDANDAAALGLALGSGPVLRGVVLVEVTERELVLAYRRAAREARTSESLHAVGVAYRAMRERRGW